MPSYRRLVAEAIGATKNPELKKGRGSWTRQIAQHLEIDGRKNRSRGGSWMRVIASEHAKRTKGANWLATLFPEGYDPNNPSSTDGPSLMRPVLSNDKVAADASVDDVVATIRMTWEPPSGWTWAYDITNDPDEKFKIPEGTNELQLAATPSASSHDVTIRATLVSPLILGAETPILQTFTIEVIPA